MANIHSVHKPSHHAKLFAKTGVQWGICGIDPCGMNSEMGPTWQLLIVSTSPVIMHNCLQKQEFNGEYVGLIHARHCSYDVQNCSCSSSSFDRSTPITQKVSNIKT